MPEDVVGAASAPPDAGAASGSSAGGPPATAGAVDGQRVGGASPPAAPATGAPAVPEAGADGTDADPWAEAARYRREAEEERSRRIGNQREYLRLKSLEDTLRSRFGDDYESRLNQAASRSTAPQPTATVAGQQTAQPQPTAPPPANATANEFADWMRESFSRLDNGFYETVAKASVNDVGDPVVVNEQVWRPPDRSRARQFAKQFDTTFRQMGVDPPWGTDYGMQRADTMRTAQTVQDGNALTKEDVLATYADLDERRDIWADGFGSELGEIGTKELGVDFFQQPVKVTMKDNRTGQQSQVTLTREKALYRFCKPSLSNPNGVPLRAGLLELWPGDVMKRYGEVAVARGARPGAPGMVPGAAPGGPPADPNARKQMAEALTRFGIADNKQFAAMPPEDASEVIIDTGQGRMHPTL